MAQDLAIGKESGEYLRPLFEGTQKDGTAFCYPDVARDFNDKSFDYYRKRLKDTKNPLLAARYLDVLIEIARDFSLVQECIKAHLNSMSLFFDNDWDHEASLSFDRAYGLCVNSKNKENIGQLIQIACDHCDKLFSEGRPRFVFEILESLIRRSKNYFDLLSKDKIFSYIDNAIKFYTSNQTENPALASNFIELKANASKALLNGEAYKASRIELAEYFTSIGDRSPGSGMRAAVYFEKALKIYQEIGVTELDELKVKIQTANSQITKNELKRVQSKVEIPNEKIERDRERFFNPYKGKSISDQIRLFSSDPRLIASVEKTRLSVVEQSKQFIHHLFPVRVMHESDICIRTLHEDDEKIKYNTNSQLLMNYQLKHEFYIGPFLKDILQDPSGLKEILSFVGSSPVIKREREPFLVEALKQFQDKSYISAIHIFAPLVEGVFRDLLIALELPVWGQKNDKAWAVSLQYMLSILKDIEGIDPDFLEFVRIFLIDELGLNLKNDISHAIASIVKFNQENATMMLFIILRLSALRIQVEHRT